MLGKDYQVVHNNGIDAAISITNGPMSLSESSKNANELVEGCVEESLRLIQIGLELSV
jgi:glycerate kinase